MRPKAPEFSVVALGKLGGRELNYSSDIDLMFVYSGDAADSRRILQSRRQPHDRHALDLHRGGLVLPGRFTAAPRRALRRGLPLPRRRETVLRFPRTRLGTPDADQSADRGRRSRSPGASCSNSSSRSSTGLQPISAPSKRVSETRARMHEKLRLEKERHAKPAGADVKLAKGGIRDIEFLVQCLQRLHGGREPWVRHGGTLLALSRLRDKELLSPSNTRGSLRRTSSCGIWSTGSSSMKIVRRTRCRTTKDQLDLLARKMPFSGLPSAGTLERELDHHFTQRAGSLRSRDPFAAVGSRSSSGRLRR